MWFTFYTYKELDGSWIGDIWSSRFLISNDSRSDLVGEGHGRDLLSTNVTFRVLGRYRVKDVRLEEKSAKFTPTVGLGTDGKSFWLSFRKWSVGKNCKVRVFCVQDNNGQDSKDVVGPAFCDNEEDAEGGSLINGRVVFGDAIKGLLFDLFIQAYSGNCCVNVSLWRYLQNLGVDGLTVRLTAFGQAVNARFSDFRVDRPIRDKAFAVDSDVLAVACWFEPISGRMELRQDCSREYLFRRHDD